MTRELKYLDKTGMEPKGHDLVVLMKQRISHSKCCTQFCNFFCPWEFLRTVDAFDLSVRQELNSGVKVLLARSFQKKILYLRFLSCLPNFSLCFAFNSLLHLPCLLLRLGGIAAPCVTDQCEGFQV